MQPVTIKALLSQLVGNLRWMRGCPEIQTKVLFLVFITIVVFGVFCKIKWR